MRTLLLQDNARLAKENELFRLQEAVAAVWSQPDLSFAHPGLAQVGANYFDAPVGSMLKAAASGFNPRKTQWSGNNKGLWPTGGGFDTYACITPPCSAHSSFASTSMLSGKTSSFSTAGADDISTVASSACLDDESGASTPSASLSKTTVMMRNLPNNYSRTMLLELMDSEGFGGAYDFIYLPIDFISSASFGYAFINLVSPEEADRFREHFQNFSRWSVPSEKVCDVTWSEVHQGLVAHIDRYRSSPVMHADMPDECKPAVFSNGVRASFPLPLKKIRAPRIRRR